MDKKNEKEMCEGPDGERLDCGGCLYPCDFEIKRRKADKTRRANAKAKADAEYAAMNERMERGEFTEKEIQDGTKIAERLKAKGLL
jgi:hypothetical protein